MKYPNDDGPMPIRDSRPVAYYSMDKRSWIERTMARLFPGKWNEPPEDLEGFAPSYMVTEVIAVLDWKDRLRALVSGKLKVSTQTKTDVVVRTVVSKSVVYVLPPNYRVRSESDGDSP